MGGGVILVSSRRRKRSALQAFARHRDDQAEMVENRQRTASIVCFYNCLKRGGVKRDQKLRPRTARGVGRGKRLGEKKKETISSMKSLKLCFISRRGGSEDREKEVLQHYGKLHFPQSQGTKYERRGGRGFHHGGGGKNCPQCVRGGVYLLETIRIKKASFENQSGKRKKEGKWGEGKKKKKNYPQYSLQNFPSMKGRGGRCATLVTR